MASRSGNGVQLFGLLLALPLISLLLLGCGGGSPGASEPQPAQMRFSSDFPSGSIGTVMPLGSDGLAWELALRDDNTNAALPSSYRTWWYVRAENVPVGKRLHLEFSRLGFAEFYVPVFSYDGKNWQHFNEQNVTLVTSGADPEAARLVLNAQFEASTVWIARTYPYTATDLSTFLQTVSASPHLRLDTLGVSPRLRLPLQLLTVHDTTQTPKETIWIHARTHSGETGPSYLLEGLLGAVLGSDALGRELRERFIFKIVPMHNSDGVNLGNYRTNADSVNLESSWKFDAGSLFLQADAPAENQLVNQGGMVPALLNGQAPVVLALNLHSSNASPDTAAFFFPHFGSDPAKYSSAQRNLWHRQLDFIHQVALAYHGRIEQPPAEGGLGFLASAFPETWWWAQRQDAVNAITLETTYGRAGFDHWVTQNDLRDLGVAVTKAIHGLGMEASHSQASPVFRLPFKAELYREQK